MFPGLAESFGAVVLYSCFPPFLFLSPFRFPRRHLKLPSQLIPSSVLIFDRLIDSSVAGCALDIDGVQTSHISFIQSYFILKGELFWAFEDVFFLDF